MGSNIGPKYTLGCELEYVLWNMGLWIVCNGMKKNIATPPHNKTRFHH